MVQNNLSTTIDSLNEAFFYAQPLAPEMLGQAVHQLVERQWRFGPHVGLFAPSEDELAEGVRLFTGEKLQTLLAARNVLGAEAARMLVLSKEDDLPVRDALALANRAMLRSCYAAQLCVIGECAHCTVGWMRYLAAGGLDDAEERLERHLQVLREHRDGQGRWERFPFYYTLLALTEIELPAATAELRYAAPACERVVGRPVNGDTYARRRRDILQKVSACS